MIRIVLRTLLRAIGWTVAALTTGAVIVVGLSIFAGYRPVVITTGSMGDTAPPSSVVIAAPRTADQIGTGDIVVMRRAGRPVVTHRVVELEIDGPRRFAVTKGDANEDRDADVYPIGETELVGRWVVPWVGHLVTAFAAPVIALSVLAAIVGCVALTLLRWIWRPAAPVGGHVPNRAGSPATPPQRSARTAAATGVLVVFLFGGVAWALFSATESVAGNVFGTDDCFDARVASVQQGTAVSSSNGTQAVAITAVDPAKSFLLFSVASSANEPTDALVQGRLLNATTVQFTRATDSSAPPNVAIAWSVVEYDCGVTVQRGVTSGNDTSQLDLTIASADTTTSFATLSMTPPATASSFDGTVGVAPELTSATNLRLRSAGSLPSGAGYAWQVVTFTDSADAFVQRQTVTVDTATTATLATPINPANTFVLAAPLSTASSGAIGDRLVRAHLSSSSAVELTRSITGAPTVEVLLQVVTLNDGSGVQHGTVDFAAGQPARTVILQPVDTTRATAFATSTLPAAAAGGSTTMAADDVPGEASATFVVTDPTTVTLTRGATSAAASFGWQVVEWGGPNWWDAGYDFRQRVEVSATTAAAPDEYTVAVTIDHAALVTAGLARADGADLRVLRWDGTTWTELHRIVDEGTAWNSPTSRLLFRTTEPVSAQTTATYWLYYGNTTPGPALADPEQVFLLTENFETGTLGDFDDRTDATSWYAALPWTARRLLTIQSAQVAGSLTDVPVLVQVSGADLSATAQPDGDDFRFTSGDGVTPLPHEIETWDTASGTLTAWVKVPALSSTVNTPLYLYYGAPDAPDQQNSAAVWSDGYEAMWLMATDPAGPAPQVTDASPHRHEGLSAGAMTASDLVPSVGAAIDLDGVDDRFDLGTFNVASTQLTLSGWARLDGFTDTDPRIIAKSTGPTARAYELAIAQLTGTTGTVRARINLGGTTYEVAGATLNLTTWYHLAATWDGATLRVYLNGAQVGSVAAAGSLTTNTMPVTIGDTPTGDRSLDGLIDNVAIATVARSTPWLATEYAMRANPGAFVTVGAAESGSWHTQGTWTYRKPVLVDSGQVAGTLTDYPLLVQFSDAALIGAAQADGDDLVFTGSDETTRLDHQIEAWDSATGTLTAWVRVPSVDDAADTTLYLYYGNASAVDQQDPAGVFGPDADLVAHLAGPG